MHENQANKKLLYEKELDEEAIKIAAAKEASYQQALDNLAISSASAHWAIALPEDFPESLPPFTFKLGDRVRWKPMPSTDWGTIAGMEYAIHQPRNSW